MIKKVAVCHLTEFETVQNRRAAYFLFAKVKLNRCVVDACFNCSRQGHDSN